MTLNETEISGAAKKLIAAYKDLEPIPPLTETYPEITVEEAYRIQLLTVDAWRAEGRMVVGKKIGITSMPIQKMLGVDEPDYGHLMDTMLAYEDMGIAASTFIAPRIEGEIAFVLKKDLTGPGVTPADVMRSTAGVMPALEIIDSRVKDWKIKIQDTVADNASSAAFVVGAKMVPIKKLDLRNVGFVFLKNGKIVATGAGAAVLGGPAQSVAWLANKLGDYGIGLKAGEIILSGSAVAAVPIEKGDSINLTVDRIGAVSCFFS
ncbi:MAG: fumarylacetoacetate hydrolase family protein [Deltaproteobacteria bacterium]|nr:fumarylacetoacetate hydrolase family protein [Deltaproteobacteria bacterium]